MGGEGGIRIIKSMYNQTINSWMHSCMQLLKSANDIILGLCDNSDNVIITIRKLITYQ